MPGATFYYGIREFGMAAAMNGMALHGGVVPYGGTFLVFSDYCRNAIRLSAIQHAQVIYVLTHDSIGLGEDGPTHQPVEHVMSLRLIPNLNVFRPADVIETAECWALALQAEGTPSVLALSRQNLPQLRKDQAGCWAAKGAYRLKAAEAARKVVLVATGSKSRSRWPAQPRSKRRGSALMSSRCRAQNCSYAQDRPIGPTCCPRTRSRSRSRPGSLLGWERSCRQRWLTFGIDRFGASAPADQLYSYFGLTAEAIVPQITARLGQ
jgi:transketolase